MPLTDKQRAKILSWHDVASTDEERQDVVELARKIGATDEELRSIVSPGPSESIFFREPTGKLQGEVVQFEEGVAEGAIGTLLGNEPTEGGGKVDLPFLGSTSPSRVIGQFAGTLASPLGKIKYLKPILAQAGFIGAVNALDALLRGEEPNPRNIAQLVAVEAGTGAVSKYLPPALAKRIRSRGAASKMSAMRDITKFDPRFQQVKEQLRLTGEVAPRRVPVPSAHPPVEEVYDLRSVEPQQPGQVPVRSVAESAATLRMGKAVSGNLFGRGSQFFDDAGRAFEVVKKPFKGRFTARNLETGETKTFSAFNDYHTLTAVPTSGVLPEEAFAR